MKSSDKTLEFSSENFRNSYSLILLKNCINSANFIARIRLEHSQERVLSIGEPCNCEYVTSPWLFRSCIMYSVVHSSNVQPTFILSVFFRRSFKTGHYWYKLLDRNFFAGLCKFFSISNKVLIITTTATFSNVKCNVQSV